MANTTNFNWETPDDTDLVKDGAAAIRTLGNSIDTSFVDLKGGTTGQILSKATNADLDFTWVTSSGDIEGITAGTGISGGGTSGTVTITNSMATEITAAGDIIIGTGSGTFDNLPIGTTGQVLTADTTVSPYKVKWASASAGKTWTLLNSGGTSMSGSTTVTVSGISNVDDLMILVDSAKSASTGINLKLRINSDSGSNYKYSYNTWEIGSSYSTSNFNGYPSGNDTSVYLGQCSNNTASTANVCVNISGGKSTGIKVFDYEGGATAAGGSGHIFAAGGGYYNGSAAITSISIIGSSSFNGGSVWVYGA